MDNLNNSGFGSESGFGGTEILGNQSMSNQLDSSQGNGGGYLGSNDNMAGMNLNTPSNTQIPQEPCLLPCTIKQIKNAPTPAQDQPFSIDNRDVSKDNVCFLFNLD